MIADADVVLSVQPLNPAQMKTLKKGAITIATEVSSASNLGSVIIAVGEGMDVAYSGGTATLSGEDATTANKGIASFASANFTVSSGAVSITALDGGTF